MNLMQKSMLLALIGAVCLTIYQEIGYAQAQKTVLPYLKTNVIDLTSEHPDWEKIANEAFYKNQIFLVGERHGIAYSYDALWSVFTHLKQKTNLNYYLLEAPLYWELNLNTYFDTGNETYLNDTFRQAEGTFYANQNFYEFYKKLYRYNQSLQPIDRIRFVSIDVEHQFKHSHAMLLAMFGQCQKNQRDTCQFLRFFFQKDPEKTGEYVQTYRQYRQEFDKDSSILHTLLKENYFTARYLIKNINYKFIANADTRDLARDSLMYENFKERTRFIDLQKDKIFGFMGIDHCYTDEAPNARYFATYLRRHPINITSVIMLYSNAETLIPTHYLPKFLRIFYTNKPYFKTKMRSNDGLFEHQKYIGILKKAALSNLTLFNLESAASPFSQNHYFIDELKSDKPTTAYMQRIILIKNSPAATPFK
jgi:hypothetical protein